MDKERHQAGNTGGRRRKRIAVALATALAVVLTVPAFQVPVRAVDYDQDCYVTVKADDAAGYAEINEAVIKFSVYKIAQGEKGDSVDSFKFSYTDDFKKLGEDPDSIPLNLTRKQLLDGLEDTPSNYEAKYKEYSGKIAQRAAVIALDDIDHINIDDGTGSDAASTTETTELGSKITLGKSGIYLVIPHGVGTSYKKEIKNADGTTSYATVAYSPTKVYTFNPIVVTVPDRVDNGTETHATNPPGDWVYELTVNIKASEEPRFGKLVIQKDLGEIEQRVDLTDLDPMTCVFSVVGYIGNKLVYDHSVSIVIDAPGSNTLTLDRIPIGAVVTVKEEYSGAEYEGTADQTQTITIKAQLESDNPQRVEFTNQYTHTDHGGGSLTNHFEYRNGWTNPGEGTDIGRPNGSPDMKPYDTSVTGNNGGQQANTYQ